MWYNSPHKKWNVPLCCVRGIQGSPPEIIPYMTPRLAYARSFKPKRRNQKSDLRKMIKLTIFLSHPIQLYSKFNRFTTTTLSLQLHWFALHGGRMQITSFDSLFFFIFSAINKIYEFYEFLNVSCGCWYSVQLKMRKIAYVSHNVYDVSIYLRQC